VGCALRRALAREPQDAVTRRAMMRFGQSAYIPRTIASRRRSPPQSSARDFAPFENC